MRYRGTRRCWPPRGVLPVDEDRWAFELAHDGLRALAHVDERGWNRAMATNHRGLV